MQVLKNWPQATPNIRSPRGLCHDHNFYRAGSGSGFCSPGLVGGLRVWTAGLAQNPGPRGLELLGYVVKARSDPKFSEKKLALFSKTDVMIKILQ
jgi:hypothetical protein